MSIILLAGKTFFLGKCQNNHCAETRLYRRRFPARCLSNYSIIRRLSLKSRGGHLVCQRRRSEFNENNLLAALTVVLHDPPISSRRIPSEFGIAQISAVSILSSLQYNLYYITSIRALRPNIIQMQI